MQTNVDELIRDTFSHKEWNLYSNLFLETLNIEDGDECKEFIRVFFESSGKMGELQNDIALLSRERCQHIVNVYLFGIGLYNRLEILKNYIDKRIRYYNEKYKCNSSKNDFYYLWFICCLFHDLGYAKEDSSECVDISFEKGLKLIGVPAVYHRKNIESYWQFRQIIQGKYDHGIYAGTTMYKSLLRIRNENENNDDRLYWGKELTHIYNIAAWVVMCHNIWFVQENNQFNCKLYENFNLKELVLLGGEYKIRINKHPLFFFFCLIDTIEPIKKIKDISLLELIGITILKNQIIISSNLKCGCGDAYLNSVNDLNNWLTKTSRKDNQVVIELDPKNRKNR